jgi:hypothetical protein
MSNRSASGGKTPDANFLMGIGQKGVILKSENLEPPNPSFTFTPRVFMPFTVRHKYHRTRPHRLGVTTTVTLLYLVIRVWWSGHLVVKERLETGFKKSWQAH